jgi:hypothetical protein
VKHWGEWCRILWGEFDVMNIQYGDAYDDSKASNIFYTAYENLQVGFK